jgi:hypothetical protein
MALTEDQIAERANNIATSLWADSMDEEQETVDFNDGRIS